MAWTRVFQLSFRAANCPLPSRADSRTSSMLYFYPYVKNSYLGADVANSEDKIRNIQYILQKLISEYSPQKVILFGTHKGSEIQLLVAKRTSDRPISRWRTIQRMLCCRSVEILVLTPWEIGYRLAIGDPFITEILESGEILYPTP